MRVHHINAATMCPPLAKYAIGRAGKMVCHVLVVETSAGLVLVDTGLGTADIADPRGRLGRPFLAFAGPRLDAAECAVNQLAQLGFRASDVRHILPTHLDLDHAGGLADFPDADVHIFTVERDAAMRRATTMEKNRYRPAHWAHGPRWRAHAPGGTRWKGFECVRDIPGLPPEILIVPLTGHTRGHSGIAIDTGHGWLLHAGDAYFHRNTLRGRRPPWGLALFERLAQTIPEERLANVARLSELAAGDPDVRVFCAHDPREFEALVHTPGAAAPRMA